MASSGEENHVASNRLAVDAKLAIKNLDDVPPTFGAGASESGQKIRLGLLAHLAIDPWATVLFRVAPGVRPLLFLALVRAGVV